MTHSFPTRRSSDLLQLDHREDAPAHGDLAARGRADAGQDLQQRALARPVAPDDPEILAPLQLEADVLQCPGQRVGAFARSRDQGSRSEEPTSEHQSLMRIPYAVFCLKKKKNRQ